MNKIQFDGQQTDEQILSVIEPHPVRVFSSIAGIIVGDIIFITFLIALAGNIVLIAPFVRMFAIPSAILFAFIAILWVYKTHHGDKTYITDRRIIRFDVVTPFFTNKRALFWNEVLKVKAIPLNMVLRLMKIGKLQIEPVAADGESILITDVYYFEHLANYIDKIVYLFKNTPQEIANVKPFIAKPKGQRD